MRRAFRLLLILALVFGADVCVHSTPQQRQAFSQAVRRSATYRAVERAVPDRWFEEWGRQWREWRRPHEDTTAADEP